MVAEVKDHLLQTLTTDIAAVEAVVTDMMTIDTIGHLNDRQEVGVMVATLLIHPAIAESEKVNERQLFG